MLKFDNTFIWMIINILVLYWILKKILFKPVTAFMENRAKNIKDMYESAKTGKEEAEALKVDLKKQMDNAVAESEKIINEAKDRAQNQYDEILKKAKEDARMLLEKAAAEIELERKNAFNELKAQIAGIALFAASKVIEKNLDSEANEKLVKEFIDEAGAA